ncbi:MAG TPA: hypothetical protein VJ756_14295 [Terriglobales bacterium]|nr:hypothetical protein [Terriglobales bacterium]
MIDHINLRTLALLFVICLLFRFPGLAQNVTTNHNDNARTGQNLSETTLTTSNVNVSNFGKLFFRTVDGYIFAQPLYVSGLNVGGATRNVVFVATEHNSVYAFDADDPNHPAPLWHVNLGTPVPSDDVCVPLGVCPYDDLQPEIGITSTPVIDTAANAIYVVAHTKNTSDSSYHFVLHKLSLTSGADIVTPAEITASGFTALYQLNRPGLLLLNGAVYLAFGSAGDFGDWHGWVMSYDTTTLNQLHVYNSTPGNVQNFVQGESGGGGIFSCGQGLITDGTYIYFLTGNGPFDANSGGQDYADSAIKLRASDLAFIDFFTPSDALTLGQNNIDLGAGGPLLIPNTNPGLLVGGGKDGVLRVLDTSNMGQFNTSDQVVQEWQAITNGAWIMGSPVYWNSPNWGPVIYLWASGNVAKAWKFNGSTFQTTPVSLGSITSPAGESNTSPLALSANRQQAGTGILWAPTSSVGDPNKANQPGIFHAFDASNLNHELWNSQQDSARDAMGVFAKFNPPTVAKGKVYLGTFSGQLLVYGLNPPAPSGIAYVQGTSKSLAISSSQISDGYPFPQNAGDLNVVVVGWADTTSQIQSVTDSNGNSYSLAVPPKSSSSVTQAIYYASNIGGGVNTITVNFKQSAALPSIRILEYSGVAITSPLDVTASAAGTSSTNAGAIADSGSATTHFSNELIFGADTDSNQTLKPGDPFVTRIFSTAADIAEDHVVNVPDTYGATVTVTPGSNWVMQMATFKASSQPSGPPPSGGFALTASPNTATVSAGASASYMVTVSPQNGFTGMVSLACSGAPAGAQCSLSPSTVAPGNTSTLSVTTAGATVALRMAPAPGVPLYSWWLVLPGIVVGGLGWTASSRKRRILMCLLAFCVLALLALQLSCGGGGSSSPPPPPPPGGGTPPGTYSITVTGSSGSTQTSVPVTLVVQ